MSVIIGSCGHDITDLTGGPDATWGAIVLARLHKDGTPAASYECVCNLCRAFYIANDCVLTGEEEVKAWVNGTLPRNPA